MKERLYTWSHRTDLLGGTGNPDTPLDARQHAHMVKTEFAEHFSNPSRLLAWYLSENADKLPILGYVVQTMRQSGARRVLSLGAGPCVLEFLLSLTLGEADSVVAVDFDEFMMGGAKRNFPQLKLAVYDYAGEPLSRLASLVGPLPSVSLFLGSSYVLEDERFVELLRELRQSGVRMVMDFQAGFLRWPWALWGMARRRGSRWARRIWKGKEFSPGKFHGYARDRRSLRQLYLIAGWTIKEERRVGSYPYVAVLQTAGGAT